MKRGHLHRAACTRNGLRRGSHQHHPGRPPPQSNRQGDQLIYITHIRTTTPGTRHEHISELRWHNPENGSTGHSTTQEIIDWIEQERVVATVHSNPEDVRLRVVNSVPKYLRTFANGTWTDNLLALPRF